MRKLRSRLVSNERSTRRLLCQNCVRVCVLVRELAQRLSDMADRDVRGSKRKRKMLRSVRFLCCGCRHVPVQLEIGSQSAVATC